MIDLIKTHHFNKNTVAFGVFGRKLVFRRFVQLHAWLQGPYNRESLAKQGRE